MRRMVSVILTVAFMLGAFAASAEGTGALDAFAALTGQQAQINDPGKTNAEYLADIMAGVYAAKPADTTAAAAMAPALPYLSGISTRDIAAFASANQYPVRQVRNAYYKALANVFHAEVLCNPASEEQYRNVQVLLSLFLEDDATADSASREAIRNSMNATNAAVIAAGYGLPAGFVEFVVMDENWDDDSWENDEDWRAAVGWDDDDIYEDSNDDLALGDRDTADSYRIAEMQERLIALGYLTGKADGVFGEQTEAALIQYQLANGAPATGVFDDDDYDDMLSADVVARWDYDNSFDYDDTPDVQDSPDPAPAPAPAPTRQDSPDNSPDYDSSYDSSGDSPDYEDS